VILSIFYRNLLVLSAGAPMRRPSQKNLKAKMIRIAIRIRNPP
jgi:hypothetical protein